MKLFVVLSLMVGLSQLVMATPANLKEVLCSAVKGSLRGWQEVCFVQGDGASSYVEIKRPGSRPELYEIVNRKDVEVHQGSVVVEITTQPKATFIGIYSKSGAYRKLIKLTLPDNSIAEQWHLPRL